MRERTGKTKAGGGAGGRGRKRIGRYLTSNIPSLPIQAGAAKTGLGGGGINIFGGGCPSSIPSGVGGLRMLPSRNRSLGGTFIKKFGSHAVVVVTLARDGPDADVVVTLARANPSWRKRRAPRAS